MAVYGINGQEIGSAYNLQAVSLLSVYDIQGSEIQIEPPVPPGPSIDYDSYTIEPMFTKGWSYSQSFSIYNGLIYQARDTNAGAAYGLHVLDPETGVEQSFITAEIGHCNSCQFSTEFYSLSDALPLFIADLKVFRITGTTSTVVKRYKLDSTAMPYYLGFGIDDEHHRMYVAGYTDAEYNYQSDNGGENKVRIITLDMSAEYENADGTYSMPVLAQRDYDWFPCIQGCCFGKGFFCVTSGYFNTVQRIFLIDPATLDIKHTITIDNRTESEGCSWLGDDLIVAQEPSSLFYKRVVFDTN